MNYGDERGKSEEEEQMTEEEWLAKEKKEIEEVEKTVSIRFANYSTLMRAQSLTAGLSAQLALFLTSMGGSSTTAAAAGASKSDASTGDNGEKAATPSLL